MSTPRHYTDVMRVNGRPAMVRVHVHPSTGQPQIDPDSIEYLDSEFSPEMRAKLDRLYREIQAPCPAEPVVDDHKSPAPGIGLGIFVAIAFLGLVMACLSQPLSGGVFFGALLAAVGVGGVFRILHVNTGRNR